MREKRQKGMPVLLIDYEDDNRDLFRQILEIRGYEVITARDYQTAMRKLEENKPKAIILNPYKLGRDLQDVLKDIGQTDRSTLVVISAPDPKEKVMNDFKLSEIEYFLPQCELGDTTKEFPERLGIFLCQHSQKQATTSA